MIEKTLEKIFPFVFRILHISDDKKRAVIVQFIKFGLVGVTNTVISYVINVLVLILLSKANLSFDYVIANLVSFVLSVLWSFYWNDKYVFTIEEKGERNQVKALLKTYIAYGFTGIVLNNVLSWVWISLLHISRYIAPMINLLISVPLNFIINKFWAFSEKDTMGK